MANFFDIYVLVKQKIKDANIPEDADKHYTEIVLDEDVFKGGLLAMGEGYTAVIRKTVEGEFCCELWSLKEVLDFKGGTPLGEDAVAWSDTPLTAVLDSLSFVMKDNNPLIGVE